MEEAAASIFTLSAEAAGSFKHC